jgi:hypothetical protein
MKHYKYSLTLISQLLFLFTSHVQLYKYNVEVGISSRVDATNDSNKKAIFSY